MKINKSLATSLLILTCMAAPAFGQVTPAPYTPRLVPFLNGMNKPVLIRGAKDGSKRLFIVQQTGIIKVLQPGATTPTDFIDLSSKIVVPVVTGDERGLLGLTFHPQFSTNGKFYVNYTRVGNGTTVVAEYTTTTGNGNSNTGDIATERILFTVPQPFSNHNGGMVEFGPDGYLYIGMGDGGSANDPGARAQNRTQLLGKMLRIDPNVPVGSQVPYLIPPSNPFTGANTTRCDNGSTTSGNTCQEIWTIGMRNPWRWSFDRGGTNQLYLADVGQNAIEELDIITGGGNYGWRVYEGNQCTNLDPALCTGGATPITQIPPYFTYDHSAGRCSVAGGYVYRGTQGSLPTGAYTFADYCSGEVWMWLNNQQVLIQKTPRQVISFGEDDDGEIYVVYATGQIDKITRAKSSADFDGDLKTDIAVYRPNGGIWFVNNSSNGSNRIQQFGLSEDVVTAEDYDGDNISDIAVFRPSNGIWFVLRSGSNTVSATQFGQLNDIPAAADFDSDAKADLTVFRPSTGVWYTQRSTNGSLSVTQFGQNQDVPVASDYDFDGKADIAVFRPGDGNWYRTSSMNGAVSAVHFGQLGDVPVPGDYDGDGRSDLAVFRPAGGLWFISQSTNGQTSTTQWGQQNDLPAPGDYDGDGRDDIAVFRPSNGIWFIQRTTSGFQAMQYGQSGDAPAGAFDRP